MTSDKAILKIHLNIKMYLNLKRELFLGHPRNKLTKMRGKSEVFKGIPDPTYFIFFKSMKRVGSDLEGLRILMT